MAPARNHQTSVCYSQYLPSKFLNPRICVTLLALTQEAFTRNPRLVQS